VYSSPLKMIATFLVRFQTGGGLPARSMMPQPGPESSAVPAPGIAGKKSFFIGPRCVPSRRSIRAQRDSSQRLPEAKATRHNADTRYG